MLGRLPSADMADAAAVVRGEDPLTVVEAPLSPLPTELDTTYWLSLPSTVTPLTAGGSVVPTNVPLGSGGMNELPPGGLPAEAALPFKALKS